MVPFESFGMVPYSLSIVNMAVSLAISQLFSIKEWPDLENRVRRRSRSLKMAPFDRPYATFYWLAIVNIALSCSFWRWIISWLWNRGQRSLNVIETGTIRKLGAVSYSPSAVTVAVSVAVCEIFSVKEGHDLENQVRGRSRSLKMATFYWSATVNIALSCTICEFFDV